MPRTAVIVLAILVLAGCAASARSGSEPFSGAGDRPNSVQLVIQNRNFADARLYAIQRGRRTNLGTVGGAQDATFTLPWGFSDPLRIEINLLAGPTCTTPELIVDPGDILELQIAPVFDQSSFCRFE